MKARLNRTENILQRCVFSCERTVIVHALVKTGGNQTEAAKLLGTTRRVLGHKINKYEIDCEQYRVQRKTEDDAGDGNKNTKEHIGVH